MNRTDINRLLEDFYNGLTSSEEEKILKEFFLSQPVTEEWELEKQIFEKYLNATEIPLPEGLEDRLSEKISAHVNQSSSSPTRFYHLRIRIAAAAAVILVCVGLFTGYLKQQDNTMADTFQDPAEAALVAEQALLFLSQQLNTGLGHVKEAQDEINKINYIVYKQLND